VFIQVANDPPQFVQGVLEVLPLLLQEGQTLRGFAILAIGQGVHRPQSLEPATQLLDFGFCDIYIEGSGFLRRYRPRRQMPLFEHSQALTGITQGVLRVRQSHLQIHRFLAAVGQRPLQVGFTVRHAPQHVGETGRRLPGDLYLRLGLSRKTGSPLRQGLHHSK